MFKEGDWVTHAIYGWTDQVKSQAGIEHKTQYYTLKYHGTGWCDLIYYNGATCPECDNNPVDIEDYLCGNCRSLLVP